MHSQVHHQAISADQLQLTPAAARLPGTSSYARSAFLEVHSGCLLTNEISVH